MLPLKLRALQIPFLGFALWVVAAPISPTSAVEVSDEEFQKLSLDLSESAGYFGTDNLVSNETSFLHVNQDLIQVAPRGQVYLGAGPGQNFTYIAKSRPSLAFILDVRRDNLLYHLLFKSFFLMAEDRWEFLSFIFSRSLPSEEDRPPRATGVDLVSGLRQREADWDTFSARIEKALDSLMERYPRLLEENDRARIHSMAAKFVRDGFEIRYEIPGRPMLSFFPSYADLMLETDLHGEHRHYLNSEADFQFIKEMHEENRIIPVMGDFGGRKALAAIGEEIRRRGLTVSVFYLSNVEFYLFRSRAFRQFVENVRSLPIQPRSLFIRSYFNNWFGTWRTHPHSALNYFSTSLTQYIGRFIKLDRRANYLNYWDLVTRDYLGAPAQPVTIEAISSPPG